MSVETTSQTMRSYLDALLARGEVADSFTDEITWTTVGTGQELQRRQPVRDFISWMHTQAFDAHPKVKTLVVGDGQAALEADFVGTHTGEFLGMPATGKSVQVPYCGLRPSGRQDCGRSRLYAHGPVRSTAQVMGSRRSPGSWSAVATPFRAWTNLVAPPSQLPAMAPWRDPFHCRAG
jgi:predicted ester cyclase